ncbi:hypothetical protein [Enterobacter phage vB_ExiM_F5M1E]|nr:hypothetical protein [Enterobacter phage vB_ExiM_F1M1E]UNA03035.1 hypothetical protein [Enterobacter phage vB_ExiM_F2M1E]UNA03356.1 hypothetical protein [Enterobacter phage vB_ExiM_F4M1E]UNA03677.1 hypothetical protein [Enterobacter phage vB_ExiM_F5M1E]UNA03997.1 hypothetical protein [Pantoea phage vB_PdiM_F5M2A]
MKINEPERINLRLSNAPKTNEPDKRLIGFVIDKDELPSMGWFSETLEQYCVLLLQSRGYKVEKKEVNDRLTLESKYEG